VFLLASLFIAPPDAAADGRAVGIVAAWGRNPFGQVGPGPGPEGVKTPQEIIETTVPGRGPHGTAIAAGAYHALVVAADGTVWAWGANHAGQLGDGTQLDREKAVNVHTPGGVLTNVITVAAGQSHSLALRSDGSVWAWGDNQYGQLGDGTTENRDTAVKVSGLEFTRDVRDRVIAIAAGGWFSLALQSDGTIRAWGSNQWGQLGDGTFEDRTKPVVVIQRARGGDPLDRVKAIAAGYGFSLALRANGSVLAWGSNGNGALGSGQFGGANPIPGRVRTGVASGGLLTNVIAIAGGGDHALALIADGTVRAWGLNAWGQLGNDTKIGSALPDVVRAHGGTSESLELVTAIAAGALHSLALLSDGTVRAWGSNAFGQLGDGTDDDRPAPVTVLSTGLLDVRAIAAGTDFSVDLHGDILDTYKWGERNDGFSPFGDQSPQPVALSPTIKPIEASVAGGLAHSLILTTAGHVFAWGLNDFGQLGDGSFETRLLPVLVTASAVTLNDVKAMAAGLRHNLAVKANGSVYAWGNGEQGQLGDGTTNSSNTARPVGTTDSKDSRRGSPWRALENIIAVAGGWGHSLALRADGTVWAWGNNASGQLGIGTTEDSTVPVRVRGPRGSRRDGPLVAAYLSGIVAIAAGQTFSLALGVDGRVWAWGANESGELGDGTTIDRHFPTAVANDGTSAFPYLVGAKAIAAGGFHSLALGSAGVLRSWGANQAGALGHSGTTLQTIPGLVRGPGTELGLTNVEAIAAGVGHSLALGSDGTAWGWGLNDFGQIGDGTYTDRQTPVQVLNGSLPFIHPTVIAAGYAHSLAISWHRIVFIPR
jgi:alpha-tubulin suppressor-like RCC1 family protein